MGKKSKKKSARIHTPGPAVARVPEQKITQALPLLFLAMVITAVCFSPMLQNGFTNWDDFDYVTNNPLLRGPDWSGIWSKPLVGNYHPLTASTLAINYQISQLDPSSYLFTNYLLHLLNTGLVFYFIWLLSGKKAWVAFLTALVFGIHPMHVESVAWVSERKDVLYTFFILLAMLQYWKYTGTQQKKNYWLCVFFFLLSLLSKPAAIIFPFVFLLLDYWKGRPLDKKLLTEKIPFFLLSIIFAIVTLKIQSQSAIVALDAYPVWTRPLFGAYVLMVYLFRFIFPYPLSTFHPYPPSNNLGVEVYLAPLFVAALLAFIWYKRKNRLVVFSLLFFIVNLLLVLQIISIGSSLVSERYTYVPYIGLAFLAGMLLTRVQTNFSKPVLWGLPIVLTIVFGYMSFQRTKVWKDSSSLWGDVIQKYPNAVLPRTNRANYNIVAALDPANKDRADSLYKQALEDCNIALINKPGDIAAYENRQNVYLNQGKDKEAMDDANALIKIAPDNRTGYFTRGAIYMRRNEPDKALADFNKYISINPNVDFVYGYRGILLLNYFQKHKEAMADFTKAIAINPEPGYYYYNRSLCYFALGDKVNARADAVVATQKGMSFADDYRKALNF